VHSAGIVCPFDRPHPFEEIGHLLRGVVQEFGDYFDGAKRHDARGHDPEVEGETREPLPGRITQPFAIEDCSRAGAHWKSFFTAFWSISLSMIMAMIASRIVSR
jgi:hypothetical protein